MTGLDYWRRRLAPFARDGFDRGWLDDHAVELLCVATGAVVVLPRPGRWIGGRGLDAFDTVPVLERDEQHALGDGGRALLRALQGAP